MKLTKMEYRQVQDALLEMDKEAEETQARQRMEARLRELGRQEALRLWRLRNPHLT